MDVSDSFQNLEPLFRGLTHEIRNPIQGILASAEALRCRFEEDPLSGKLFDMIQSECVRINTLLTDLLLLSEPVRVDDTVSDAGKLLEECIRLFPKVVTPKIAGDLPKLRLDRAALRRAILAVLQNAMESNSSDGVVLISAENGGDSIKILVEDHGEGISQKDLPHVMEPFFSTKPKKAGLGLAIANRIVRLHHGDFHLESQSEKGTIVTMILPIQT